MRQPDVHGRRPVVASIEKKSVGSRDVLGLQVAGLAGGVDGFFSHDSVSGPLAAGNGDQVGGRNVDYVIADQALSVRLVRILNQRTNSRPKLFYFYLTLKIKMQTEKLLACLKVRQSSRVNLC